MAKGKRSPIRSSAAVGVAVLALTVGFELISAGLENPCGGGICLEDDPDSQLRTLQFVLGAVVVLSGIGVSLVVGRRASATGSLLAVVGGPIAGGFANVVVGEPAWSHAWPCFVGMALVASGVSMPPHLLSWTAGLVSGSGIAFALDDRVSLTWLATIPLVVAALAEQPHRASSLKVSEQSGT